MRVGQKKLHKIITMRYLVTMLLLLPLFLSAQLEVDYRKIPPTEGRYGHYVTKNGAVISLKDSITIGLPTGPDGFRFITAGWVSEDNIIAGRNIVVTGIRTFKRNYLRNKVFLKFRGTGILSPSFIDYEMALKSGEIEAISVKD